MNYRYDPSGRNTPQPHGGPGPGQGLQNQGQSQFPGISDPFIGKNNKSVGLTSPVPFNTTEVSNEFSGGVPTFSIQPASNMQIIPLPESNTSILPAAAEDTKTEKTGFNLTNSLNDLKSVVDRMGGIDGIVTTMGKVQKVVGSITQMAPLIKVLATSFTPGKKGAKIAEDDDDDAPVKRRRKKKGHKSVKGKGMSTVTPGGSRPRRKRRPPSR